MILVLFGQPGSGKTTIAKELNGMFMSIDSDRFFKVFKDTSDREGGVALLNKASDIAIYFDSTGLDCILSLPYQYKEARDYLNASKSDVYWVLLKHDHQLSPRGKYPLEYFDLPDGENVLEINTTRTSLDKTISLIENYIDKW